jgi:pre-mRNA-splicing helicase BRR2
LVEQTLEDLQENKCIVMAEDDVSPLNLGMIAAYYYINYRTIQVFEMSLKPKTRLQVLLDIITGAVEFETVPIRHHEDMILDKIHSQLPRQHPQPNFNDPHFKANLLLQAHFSRFQLPADLESDQKLILSKVPRLCQACVDVISSNGWLGPALAAMELSQMCIQAMWDKDSNLKQVPHFSQDIIARLEEKQVEHVTELMEMEDADRNSCLQLSKDEMRDVIRFVNRFPNIEVEYKLDSKTVPQGETCTITVQLERETDEEVVGPVIAPYFPGKKEEGWWLIVGESKTKTLMAIKRITLQQRQSLQLEFAAPETVGTHSLKLYFMCDSYMGVDQEFDFKLQVVEGDDAMEQDE